MPSSIRPIAFVQPLSWQLGGTTVWALNMVEHLAAVGQPTALIDHVRPGDLGESRTANQFTPPTTRSASGTRPILLRSLSYDDGESAPIYLAHDEYVYRRIAPMTIIPNFGVEPYSTCARILRQTPDAMRVIGMGHGDSTYYYDLLTHYAPLIARFVAVSPEIQERLLRELPAHRHKDILMRPYPISMPERLDRSYSQSDQPLRVAYGGRLVEQDKHISDLLILADLLDTQRINFVLDMYGEGPDSDRFRARLKRCQPSVQNRVVMKGLLEPSQMADAWLTHDVCILVSEREGTSISMLEAMGHGCIPVVTRVSGTGIIQQGISGFTTPFRQFQDMVDVIRHLDSDRARLPELGLNAHQVVCAQFSYPQYITWFLDLIDDMWREPGRGWPLHRPLTPPWDLNSERG